MGMEKKDQQRDRDRIDAVINILKKQAPLTVKQEKYCNDACVERFLKGKGDNMKKAAKHLRTVISWRESFGTDHLIADEFSSELAEGVAYVAGHDDEARPVMVFRVKQDYFKFHAQKSYLRLLVFTLEVAISSMSRFVGQFVLLFDASFFKSAPAFLNLYMGTLKVISDFYPARLHRAFVTDPPSMFSCLWKGARPFVDLWAVTSLVSSLDYDDDSLEDEAFGFGSGTSCPHRSTSLRFDPASIKSNGGAGSTSSRFAFTVSHLDSLKPWYLSSVGPATSNPSRSSAVAPAAASSSPSLVGVSPLNARSFSFASPSARSTPRGTPRPQQTPRQQPRTPRPSFLQSPAMLFSGFSRKDGNAGKGGEKGRETFLMYLRFYRRPYDEMAYRARMRPPLGGLVSIVSPHGKQRRFNGAQVQQQQHHQRF